MFIEIAVGASHEVREVVCEVARAELRDGRRQQRADPGEDQTGPPRRPGRSPATRHHPLDLPRQRVEDQRDHARQRSRSPAATRPRAPAPKGRGSPAAAAPAGSSAEPPPVPPSTLLRQSGSGSGAQPSDSLGLVRARAPRSDGCWISVLHLVSTLDTGKYAHMRDGVRILFVGDVVGSDRAAHAADRAAAAARTDAPIDFVVVNGENAAGGHGITSKIARELFAAGVDVITLGNHTYRQNEVYSVSRSGGPDPASRQLPAQPARPRKLCGASATGRAARCRLAVGQPAT